MWSSKKFIEYLAACKEKFARLNVNLSYGMW